MTSSPASPAHDGASPRFDFARFLAIRAAYGPCFTHDGERLVFVSTLAGLPQAFWGLVSDYTPARDEHRHDSPFPSWPVQVTFTDDRIGATFPSPRDNRVIVTTDSGGDERFQLLLIEGEGERVRPLTHDREAMFHFGGWSPDASAVAYVGNQRDPRYFDLYTQDLRTGDERQVAQTDGMFSVFGWAPNGQRLLAVRAESNAESYVYEVTLADGSLRRITPTGERAHWVAPQYAPDGRHVYLSSDYRRDTQAVMRIDLQRLAVETVVAAEWDVEDLALSPDGRRLAYVLNEDGASRLFVRNVASGQSTEVRQIPRGVIGLGRDPRRRDVLAWSPDSQSLAFSLATARHTRNLFVATTLHGGLDFGPAGAGAAQVTLAPQAAIPPDRLVEPQLVRYPTFDGRQIPAFLYVPHGAEPDGSHPALIIFHGGPEAQVRPDLSAEVQYFAQAGYVVLTPNVRGSTGYGKTYQALDDVEKRMDSVADGAAGADWLASSGWADQGKIACMGGSYGGFMVLACLCTYPEKWAAGVDLFGIANFVTFMEHTHPFRRRHRAAEYGSLEEHRAVLERISPIKYVERIVAPLLAVHGDRDPRVPLEETEQIVAALRARGVPTELIRFADEGHGIVRPANRQRLYPQIAAFLDRHLKQGAHQ